MYRVLIFLLLITGVYFGTNVSSLELGSESVMAQEDEPGNNNEVTDEEGNIEVIPETDPEQEHAEWEV